LRHVNRLFKAFHDARIRQRWLADAGFTIRKATAGKSLRITWVDGKTSIEVNLYPKGTSKSQVSVQHNKLANNKEAQRMKAYWAEALAGLKELLEN
jgi:uncharacterized protein YndB with AHSA1/START domain